MRISILAPLILAACAPAVDATGGGGIVAIGPGTEANLFALGLGGGVAGVSDFCTVPAAAGLPRVGGQNDPNLERIAALAPAIVLVQGRHPRVEAWCAGAGIEFHAFGTDSLEGWRAEVAWLGAHFDRAAAAAALVAECNAALAALRRPGPPVRALLVVARRTDEASGVVAAGPGTFLSQLLEAAGGVNALPESASAYPDLNEETLIRLDPEAIVEFGPSPGDDPPLPIWRRSFPGLAAVRAGRVGAISHPEALIPGPRMHEVAAAIHALLR